MTFRDYPVRDASFFEDPIEEVSVVIGDHLDIMPQGLELNGQTGQLALQSSHVEMTGQTDDFHT